MAEESPGPIWGCWNRLFGFPVSTVTGRIHAPGALTKSTLLCSPSVGVVPRASEVHGALATLEWSAWYTYLHAAECRSRELVISLAAVDRYHIFLSFSK